MIFIGSRCGAFKFKQAEFERFDKELESAVIPAFGRIVLCIDNPSRAMGKIRGMWPNFKVVSKHDNETLIFASTSVDKVRNLSFEQRVFFSTDSSCVSVKT